MTGVWRTSIFSLIAARILLKAHRAQQVLGQLPPLGHALQSSDMRSEVKLTGHAEQNHNICLMHFIYFSYLLKYYFEIIIFPFRS